MLKGGKGWAEPGFRAPGMGRTPSDRRGNVVTGEKEAAGPKVANLLPWY